MLRVLSVLRAAPLHASPYTQMSHPQKHNPQNASERVFVPMTVGGGIRAFSAEGRDYSALEVASEYFRCVKLDQV